MRRAAILVVTVVGGCATTAPSGPGIVSGDASPADAKADVGAPRSDTGADAREASDAGPDADAAISEDAMPDAKSDAGSLDAGDAAASTCSADGECRLFGSYCDGVKLRPCTCLGLRVDDPDPKCDGTVVACFLDPCIGKTATCVLGVCGAK